MKKKLETHFLVAGVGIDGLTGRLKRGHKAVRHWVVVERIAPEGKHFLRQHYGGNGGWVTLYNPFTNVMEEYSYREFTDSMSENGLWEGLWVKRNITPVFGNQTVFSPSIDAKGTSQGIKANKNVAIKKWPEAKMRAEIQKKLKHGTRPEKIPGLLVSARSGWSIHEIKRLMPPSEEERAGWADDVESAVRDHLGVDSLPAEIGTLIREKARGDARFAISLAEALCETGLLLIGPGTQARLKNFPMLPRLRQEALTRFINSLSVSPLAVSASSTRSALKVASAIRPLLASQLIAEIEGIQGRDAKKKA
jgi:hypothetical protein